jgi:hypothetical protein
MKNIHIISTDQSSKLLFNPLFKSFCIQKEDDGMFINDGKVNGANFWSLEKASNNGFKPQHIYITSDEEIKDGDWCLDIKRNIIFKSKRKEIGTSKKIPIIICEYEGCYIEEDCKKIIITTDPTLIADGVQKIDDKFLEWFIKNPTCEFVEVDESKYFDGSHGEYIIIIPQEEPKQKLPTYDESLQYILNAYKIPKELLGQEEPKPLDNLEERLKRDMSMVSLGEDKLEAEGKYFADNADSIIVMKQETLEEASERILLAEDLDLSDYDKRYIIKAMCNIANWKSKRMYSEEEVLKIINKFNEIHYHPSEEWEINKWFNQFKKK